jgi:hypothetical protein
VPGEVYSFISNANPLVPFALLKRAILDAPYHNSAGENKRGGAGRGNWGSVKDARDDEEAAVLSAVEPTEGAVVAADAAPVTEGAAAAATTETTESAKVETEPEVRKIAWKIKFFLGDV